MPYFQDASNILITGATFNDYANLNVEKHAHGADLNHLHENVIQDALHYSNQSPPTELVENSDSFYSHEFMTEMCSQYVTVLFGEPDDTNPIAAGIAAAEEREEKLVGSFFFSRDDQGRNTTSDFVKAITAQMTISIPESRKYVAEAFSEDPMVYKRSLDIQLERLIIKPLQRTQSYLNKNAAPSLVVIGNLDECGDPSEQFRILDRISAMLLQHQLPLSFLITARPLSHLRDFVSQDRFQQIVHCLDIPSPVSAYDDPHNTRAFKHATSSVPSSSSDDVDMG